MEPLTLWRHYKGNIYILIALSRLEATLEPHVVYKKGEGIYGEYWVRPLSEWHQEVSPGVRRFTKVEGNPE